MFRGWWVVAALFVMLVSSSGLGFYTLPIMVRVLSEEGLFSVHAVSFASGLFFIVTGFSGILVARLLERFDVRIILTMGGVCSAISLLALGHVTNKVELYVVYTVFGFGFSATSLVPAMAVVTHWFSQRRSIAVAVVATGLSLGGVIVAPLSARFAESHGIAAITPWLALAYLVGTLPLTWIYVRNRPSDLGLRPDGRASSIDDQERSDVDEGIPYRAAVKSHLFICLGIGYVLVMTAQVGVIMHIYNFAAARVDPLFAQLILATLSISSVLGRFFGGFIMTIISARSLGSVLIATNTICLLLYGITYSPTLLLVITFIFGISVGNLIMIQALILSETFGIRDYGRIYALSQLINAFGYMAGPEIMGASFGHFGGYEEALILVSICSGLGLVFFVLAGTPSLSEPFLRRYR